MNLLGVCVLLCFVSLNVAELSQTCQIYANYYASCIQNSAINRYATTRKNDFQSRVKACFQTAKCEVPNFGATLFSEKVQAAMITQVGELTRKNLCVQPKLHDAQAWWLSECREKKNGKKARNVMNFKENEREKLEYLQFGMSIAKAQKKCSGPDSIGLPACLAAAYKAIHKDACKQIKQTCNAYLNVQNCKVEYKDFQDDVCPCVASTAAQAPTRSGKVGEVEKTPTPAGTADIQKQLAEIAAKLFPSGSKLFRFKRQTATAADGGFTTLLGSLFKGNGGTGTTTTTTGGGQSGGGILDVITKLGQGIGPLNREPKLDVVGKPYGLNNAEVNQTLLDCGQKSINYGGTHRDNALLACKCDRMATAIAQDTCLASADCMGTENLAFFKEALKMVANMNEDHMRYFCDCEEGA